MRLKERNNMSKPKKFAIKDKDYFAWKYEEQTKIKHKVLGSYAKIWLSKLGLYKIHFFLIVMGDVVFILIMIILSIMVLPLL